MCLSIGRLLRARRLERADRGAARLGDCRLTLALQRAYPTFAIDADVGREHDEQLA